MRTQTLVPVLLLAGALLAAGIGWLTRRPRAAAVSALLLLAATAVLAAAVLDPLDVRPWQRRPWSSASAGLVALAGGGPLTTAVFQLVDGRHEDDVDSVRNAGAVLRGGAWIGALERGAVFATLVAGWPEGLAIVLGLKGLGRYPELRNQEHPGTAERFIIGTFTSVLWAAGCAGVVALLV